MRFRWGQTTARVPMADREVTRVLQAHAAGDREALDEALPLVYQELRRIAQSRLRGERADHTLNATDLVHEAYVKLAQVNRIQYQNRAHFFALAARAMRQVLLDHAERRRAQKRGGGVERVDLDGVQVGEVVDLDELIALESALERLESMDPRMVRVVECRCFGGMSIRETSEALSLSEATVSRDWAAARAWLARELSASSTIDGSSAGP
ncbi:MAG: sigma-70 family RNA polymerase sigma factor [Gemmatimonas sp.]|nr:sigma-70 family RNA polymerase sigma factor [Gemmatimonas sp.]